MNSCVVDKNVDLSKLRLYFFYYIIDPGIVRYIKLFRKTSSWIF